MVEQNLCIAWLAWSIKQVNTLPRLQQCKNFRFSFRLSC